jgi:protein ImuB
VFWLCLRFPQLALDAVRACADATGDARPLAVIEGPLPRRQVLLADAAAARAGVRPGQPLAAARVLCPGLHVLARQPEAERQLLESLASWAYRFSADIVLAASDTLLLEAGGSLALFGGWAAFERRLRSELAGFGFAATLAAAPTGNAARVLALQGDGIAIPALAGLDRALGGVPLGSSGLEAGIVRALQGMGFRHLRDLFHLPRAELARRTGTAALAHLDRLRGHVAESWPRWHPAEHFERRIEFAAGVESQAMLAFPLQRLLRELALFLLARDGGVQRFTLVLGHERGARTRVDVGLLTPQREPQALFELARARLERIDLAAPVHALTLRAEDLPPLCPLHRDLFDGNRGEQLEWPRLAERLRARLGDAALQGLACAGDHRPARAWRFVPPLPAPAGTPARTGGNATSSTPAPLPRDRGTRPFWLLRRPLAWRDTPARVLAGPERIESGWWDGHDQRRDYYLVETRQGQRAWVFVEAGSPVGTGQAVHWTLHGWFA